MAECIVAYTGEGERYRPLIEKSMELAQARSSRLIFYDADAASQMGNPLPTFWSSTDGPGEEHHDRLGPVDLEKAGRAELRDRVNRARELGIDAFGWLPVKRGAKDLADYATEQEATLLIVPSDLDHQGLSGWFKRKPSVEKITEEADQPVLVVELEPQVAHA